MLTNEPVYQFEDVTVDSARFQALRAGVALDLEPKALEVLLFLIERRERLVLKEELLDGVWRDTFVTPNALTRVIAQLRKALGDDAQEARVIETVPRKGYRFLPAVSLANNSATPVVPSRPTGASEPTSERRRRTPVGPAPPPFWRMALPLVAGAFLALTGWIWTRAPAPEPLTLTDVVQLTTSAGFEADPALSPDGRRLAYTAEENGFNEIYVRPLGEGKRIQVTSDGGQNGEAVWSPDGERLAYHSHARGGIWIVPATGGVAKQVVAVGSEPAWSPDGVAAGVLDLPGRARRARGNHGRSGCRRRGAVGDAPGFAPRRASRSGVVARRQPRRVLYVRRERGCVAVGRPRHRRRIGAHRRPRHAEARGLYARRPLALLERHRPVGQCRHLVRAARSGQPGGARRGAPGRGWRLGLSIARDGTIAYAIRRMESDLWSLPVSATGQPAGDPVPLMRDTSRNTYPAFSPDGRHLAFLGWHPGSPSDLWIMNMQTRASEIVAPGKDDEFFPTWMPDNRRVLTAIGRGPVRRVSRVAIDTRQVEDVQGLPAQMSNLALSPDGRDLAYHVTDEGGGLTVWRVPATGGEPVRLTPPNQSAGYPAWSPDGRRLALEVDDGGTTQVWVVNRDGTGFRRVTSSAGQHWPHSWAPDNDRIVFAGERDAVWNIWTVSTSTGLTQQVTRFSTPNGYVQVSGLVAAQRPASSSSTPL